MGAISRHRERQHARNPWHIDGTCLPEVGEALAVGVIGKNGSEAVLWKLAPARSGLSSLALGPQVSRTLQFCRTALPRSLPFLWRDVSRELRDHAPSFTLLSQRKARLERLEGPSYGLAMALAYASKLIGQPLPADVAATAAIDASGLLTPVLGVEAKLLELERNATRIKTLLVASSQAERLRAQGLGAGRVQLVGVSTLAAAVSHCFENLQGWFLEQASVPDSRESTVASLFRLALGSRSAAVDWTPIHRCASALLEEDASDSDFTLSDSERRRVDFAAAVALRHERNRGEFRHPPTADWIRSFPQPLRLKVLSQVVQQSADTGSPSAEDALRLVESFRVRDAEAFPDHLRLEGALARLQAARGHLEEAFEAQVRLARAWIERLDVRELSFNLSETWRLVGALGDASLIPSIEAMVDDARAIGDLDVDGDSFIRLARAKARIQLGAEEADAVCELIRCETLPLILRLRLRRWLRRCDPGHELPENYAKLEEKAGGDELAVIDAFCTLDDAVSGDEPEAAEALACLRARRPEVIRRLEAAARTRGLPPAHFVREAHPYG